VAFLQEHGIIQSQRTCSKGHHMKITYGARIRRRCMRKGCRNQEEKSLRTKNWFANSKLPLQDAILFIYSWAYAMTSIKYCERELSMNHNTIMDSNNYLREVCCWKLQQNNLAIGGPNTTVEIDESMFVRRKNHVGRVLPQQWVFGGICRETKECFMMCVPDRTAATLMPIIQARIRPGTTII
jgi:hypothetical protein